MRIAERERSAADIERDISLVRICHQVVPLLTEPDTLNVTLADILSSTGMAGA
jgi:hypothetical protein